MPDDTDQPSDDFLSRWNALGRQIITLTMAGTPFALMEKVRLAEHLITKLVWMTVGDNLTQVALLLETSRRRVRESLATVRPVRR